LAVDSPSAPFQAHRPPPFTGRNPLPGPPRGMRSAAAPRSETLSARFLAGFVRNRPFSRPPHRLPGPFPVWGSHRGGVLGDRTGPGHDAPTRPAGPPARTAAGVFPGGPGIWPRRHFRASYPLPLAPSARGPPPTFPSAMPGFPFRLNFITRRLGISRLPNGDPLVLPSPPPPDTRAPSAKFRVRGPRLGSPPPKPLGLSPVHPASIFRTAKTLLFFNPPWRWRRGPFPPPGKIDAALRVATGSDGVPRGCTPAETVPAEVIGPPQSPLEPCPPPGNAHDFPRPRARPLEHFPPLAHSGGAPLFILPWDPPVRQARLTRRKA